MLQSLTGRNIFAIALYTAPFFILMAIAVVLLAMFRHRAVAAGDHARRAVRCRHERSCERPRRLRPHRLSAHLAAGASPALSEFRVRADHRLARLPPLDGAGDGGGRIPEPLGLDVLVLHNINHRGKPKRLADVCLVLNVEDTHLVTYSVRKLDEA